MGQNSCSRKAFKVSAMIAVQLVVLCIASGAFGQDQKNQSSGTPSPNPAPQPAPGVEQPTLPTHEVFTPQSAPAPQAEAAFKSPFKGSKSSAEEKADFDKVVELQEKSRAVQDKWDEAMEWPMKKEEMEQLRREANDAAREYKKALDQYVLDWSGKLYLKGVPKKGKEKDAFERDFERAMFLVNDASKRKAERARASASPGATPPEEKKEGQKEAERSKGDTSGPLDVFGNVTIGTGIGGHTGSGDRHNRHADYSSSKSTSAGPTTQSCCLHQGASVQCPSGLPPGSQSLQFVQGGTKWQTPSGEQVTVPQTSFPKCTAGANEEKAQTSRSEERSRSEHRHSDQHGGTGVGAGVSIDLGKALSDSDDREDNGSGPGYGNTFNVDNNPPVLADKLPTAPKDDPKDGNPVTGGKVHRGTGTRTNPNDATDKRAAFYLWIEQDANATCKEFAWYQFAKVTVTVEGRDVTAKLASAGAIENAIGGKTHLGKWDGDWHVNDEKKAKKKKPHIKLPGEKPEVEAGPYAPMPIPGTDGKEGLVDAPNWGKTGAWKHLVSRLADKGIIKKKATGGQPPDSSFTMVITTNFKDFLYCIDPAPPQCLGSSEETYVETIKFKITWTQSSDIELGSSTEATWISNVTVDSDESSVTFGSWKKCP